MPAKFKWLLLPPAIALILFLGPLRGGIGTVAPTDEGQGSIPPTAITPGEGIPVIPGMDQIISTLLGVLILGAVGIIVFAKTRKPKSSGLRTGLVEHKQTLRVTAKHQVHVLQFDGQLLLLGTCESNMTILRSGESSDATADELALVARDQEEEEEEGAVPKDMILPRPSGKRAQLPKTMNLSQFTKLLAKARAGQV